ncbi:hypothetical protein BGX31_002230, partial [Mortierella sp. GBA43]
MSKCKRNTCISNFKAWENTKATPLGALEGKATAGKSAWKTAGKLIEGPRDI